MNPYSGTIICLAYIIAGLSTAVFGFPPELELQKWGVIALCWAISCFLAALIIPRLWLTGPNYRLWLIAALVAILATAYVQLRVPQPGENDISNVNSQLVQVSGKILSQPRLTRKQTIQFWFSVQQVNEIQGSSLGTARVEAVTGKLYVTVPLLQGTGLYPGQEAQVTGILSQPKPKVNPGAFDFAAYLQRQGCFATLRGQGVSLAYEGKAQPWGLWQLRQRIIRAQVRWLKVPAGPLVSSMVLGRRAVDLPYDIRDQFIRAGLAHVLAASGFHVALLLGVVLTLTRGLSERWQLILGLCSLTLYSCLTGLYPSVMRAAIMGVGALVALVTRRKVRRFGSLLFAATILLLFNPLWLWDLGFQLSFMATLGLIVTVPAVVAKLDWLPPTIAQAIAIPIAASIWTLPLLSYTFNTFNTYSLITNIILTPLIAVIALGGMISALAALIYPLAGSAMAWLLYYPTHLLLGIVEFCTAGPGSLFAVGTISLKQMLVIYGLFCLIWWDKWWQRRWWLVALFAISIVVIPLWHKQSTLFQVTVLAAKERQVVVIQDQGTVTLINSGDSDTGRYTILPFLAAEGINKIDCAIALQPEVDVQSSWSEIQTTIPIKSWFHLSGQSENQPPCHLPIKSLSEDPPLLQLEIGEQTWWLLASDRPLGRLERAVLKSLVTDELKYSPDVLFASGRSFKSPWWLGQKPKVAIAPGLTMKPETQKQLEQQDIQLYWTGRDGAIQWRPALGWQTTLERVAEDASMM